MENHSPGLSICWSHHAAGPKDLSSSKRALQENPALGSTKHQRRPNSPLLRLQARRWVPGDEEEGSHGVHVTERGSTFCHLDSGDSQRPQVTLKETKAHTHA